MEKDDWPRRRSEEFRAALALLSRLPVRAGTMGAEATAGTAAGTGTGTHTPALGARGAWAWPLVGALLGLIAGGGGTLALALGLPAGLGAGLALVLLILLTGALHEDGLADSADGLWGGWSRERRLEIMKDSHIGTYGVLALLMVMLLRWQALAVLAGDGRLIAAMIVAGALSRAPMALVMRALPNARGRGLAQDVGRPPAGAVRAALLIALLLAIVLGGWGGLLAALLAGFGALTLAMIALERIGGQTGDILGAVQQICEALALIALLSLR